MGPRKLLSFVAIGALVACAPRFDPQSLQVDPDATPTLETVRTVFADRTMITQSLHGTQIEYHRPDGRSFLWYPGNRSVVPANWKLGEYPFGQYEICWQYPSSSRNGLTGLSAGGRFQCTPDRYYFDDVTEILRGDPFTLASGRVPVRIQDRGDYSAAQLAATAQINTDRLSYVYRKQ